MKTIFTYEYQYVASKRPKSDFKNDPIKNKKWLVFVIGNQESSNVSNCFVKLSDRTEMKYL